MSPFYHIFFIILDSTALNSISDIPRFARQFKTLNYTVFIFSCIRIRYCPLQRELTQQAESLRNTIEITKTKSLERREMEEKAFAEEVSILSN